MRRIIKLLASITIAGLVTATTGCADLHLHDANRLIAAQEAVAKWDEISKTDPLAETASNLEAIYGPIIELNDRTAEALAADFANLLVYGGFPKSNTESDTPGLPDEEETRAFALHSLKSFAETYINSGELDGLETQISSLQKELGLAGDELTKAKAAVNAAKEVADTFENPPENPSKVKLIQRLGDLRRAIETHDEANPPAESTESESRKTSSKEYIDTATRIIEAVEDLEDEATNSSSGRILAYYALDIARTRHSLAAENYRYIEDRLGRRIFALRVRTDEVDATLGHVPKDGEARERKEDELPSASFTDGYVVRVGSVQQEVRRLEDYLQDKEAELAKAVQGDQAEATKERDNAALELARKVDEFSGLMYEGQLFVGAAATREWLVGWLELHDERSEHMHAREVDRIVALEKRNIVSRGLGLQEVFHAGGIKPEDIGGLVLLLEGGYIAGKQ